MDGQQIHALLGQWYDIVGQARGGGRGRGGPGMRASMGPGMGPGMRHDRGRRRRDRWWGGGFSPWDYYGYGGYPYGYYDQQQQGIDPATLFWYFQMFQAQQAAQQAQQQVPVPVPVPVPTAMEAPAPGAPGAPAPGGPPPGAPPPQASGWIGAELMAPPDFAPFPARAAVVDAPLPTQANRDILPMSTGVPILPTQSAQITGRPQTLVFKIGRFVISNAGTAGGAADWIVNDIKIGNRSQFVQSGDVPGDLFATNAIDTFVRFESAQTAMDVVVVVTYIGLNESGCPFFGAMVGTAAV